MAKLSKILILGGTGFLGNNLINKLNPEKFEIYSISLNKKTKIVKNKNCKYYFFDASNKSNLREFFVDKKFDYIVNFSGYIEHSNFDDNAINLLNCSINILYNILTLTLENPPKRFIQIGSADEYGLANSPFSEAIREQPVSFYGLAKVTCSHIAEMIYKIHSYPICVIRPFIVYGPGQSNVGLIPYVINSCLLNKKFEVSEGYQERDFIYIDDFTNAILKSLFIDKVNGEILNIGSGKSLKVKSIILKILDLIKSGEPLFGKYIPVKKIDNQYMEADIKKAKRILNWEPRIQINEGLALTISEFK